METADRRQTLQRQANIQIGALVFGGVMTMIAAVLLAGLVSPFFIAIGLVSLADFWLAWMFGSGRIGPLSQLRDDNPYARED